MSNYSFDERKQEFKEDLEKNASIADILTLTDPSPISELDDTEDIIDPAMLAAAIELLSETNIPNWI